MRINIRKKYRRWIRVGLGVLAAAIVLLMVANRFIEPVLRDRLHTLIVQGSDSLYTYELGDLDANLLGGSVEVKNLRIRVDSARMAYLKRTRSLPSLTMTLDLERGRIRGLAVLPLLLGKKIVIREILSADANVRLSRHVKDEALPQQTTPLWKAMQPAINLITIDRIRLDGIKLLYRNADTSESVKLQFDRCDARFDDIRIDSAATSDTARLGFVRRIQLRFDDLKFRSFDSSYKMKAENIVYSSERRSLEIDSFKLQPTREEKEDFYGFYKSQRSMQVIELAKVTFANLQLDQFIHNNVITADSIVIRHPSVDLYTDRTQPSSGYSSKVGEFPHQKLLGANATIRVGAIIVEDADFRYREKNARTGQEGVLSLADIDMRVENVTNDTARIRTRPIATAAATGTILGSPLEANFRFFLDSTEGEFEAWGAVRNVSARQLNPLSVPLANVELRSFQVQELRFRLRGEDYEGRGEVAMRYSDLALILRKQDEETGQTGTKKFLTKILNKFVIYPSNPGPDGVVRNSGPVRVARISSKSFFGLIWSTIFSGMQNIIMKSGRYE